MKKQTLILRHSLVKMIAPKLYEDFSSIPLGDHRPMIDTLSKMGKHNLVGVEIGVSRGNNAIKMLKTLDLKKLYLIDPYTSYVDGDTDSTVIDSSLLKICYEKTKKIFDKFNNVVFIIDYSYNVVNQIPILDFVYIDGNHNYNDVKRDINLYWQKVKNGGMLGGHDFEGRYQGVVWAVTEFAREKHLKLYSNFRDWWFIKNDVCNYD